jgi:hypothetical protein
MRAAAFLVGVVGFGACDSPPTQRKLDVDYVSVTSSHLRTDTIGSDRFTERATFVLVDAANGSDEGAYVTLGGTLSAGTAVLGELKPQSLWVPGHGERTFALVDSERVERPTADAARIVVRGAILGAPPVAHVDHVHDMDDYGKRVVQGELVNDADRPGTIMVIASFHDTRGAPMTRPFELIAMQPNGHQAVQFVGPPGSVHGDLFIGEVAY